ncbi:MAG: AAA family ATPase [Candidatus Moduliflexus flocculans]|nr:AAA family ATPase [Candidatus Moduliflexus flocculans]
MLKRKIDTALLAWMNEKPKKALLVKGARQVGKTTSIETFGKNHYRSFIELNFERNPEYREIFAGSLDAKTIILNMSAMGLGPFTEQDTLIFFDEVQSCPNARTAIKFLIQDGRYDYIESGSLLGINDRDVSSYPVGYETQCEMSSLDFEEFLWAKGIGADVIDLLRKSYETKKTLEFGGALGDDASFSRISDRRRDAGRRQSIHRDRRHAEGHERTERHHQQLPRRRQKIRRNE